MSAPTASYPAAIYRTAISHVRRTPLHNAFTYRSYSWYVDVDHLPQLPRLLRPLAGFFPLPVHEAQELLPLRTPVPAVGRREAPAGGEGATPAGEGFDLAVFESRQCEHAGG